MLRAYLDIETTGLDPENDSITVIGIYLTDTTSQRLVQLVGEENTKPNLLEALKDIKVIYTYNGTEFDLPFIAHSIDIDLTELFKHHDLMLDCWKNKLFGGQKAVERKLDIPRQLKEVNGLEAVRLWERYQIEGDQNALNTLLAYNKEDVVNLQRLRKKLLTLTSP